MDAADQESRENAGWMTVEELAAIEARHSATDIGRLCRELRRARGFLGLEPAGEAQPHRGPCSMRRWFPPDHAASVRVGSVLTQWTSDPPLFVTRVIGLVRSFGGSIVLAVDVRYATPAEIAAAELRSPRPLATGSLRAPTR